MGWISYALVPTTAEGRTRHLVGFPPELTQGDDQRVSMPNAAIVLMFEREGGSVLSYRFSEDGEFAGDTWDANRDEAVKCLEYEYGIVLEWKPMPSDVDDPKAFVVAVFASG